MRPVPNLRTFLAGHWRLDRSVLDHRLSISGDMTGEARFTPDGGSLLYSEQGTLNFGAHHGPAEQRLTFEFGCGDAHASVRFHDGRPFHELDLSEGQATTTHACGPDLYEADFVAIDATQWRSVWRVKGPRKDQEISTLYTRVTT